MVSRVRRVLLISCLLPFAGRAGDMRVDKGKGCVFVTCRVAKQGVYKQLEGRIEYVLCGADGKTYESLLVTDVQPGRLAEALIGIGLQAGAPAKDTPAGYMLPTGDRLRLSLTMEDGAGTKPGRLEEFVLDSATGAAMETAAWVFTGSRPGTHPETGKSILDAELKCNLVALHHRDPTVLIQNARLTARDFRRFKPNLKRLPPEGANVTLVVERLVLPRKHYLVHGRVQGVGFRAFVQRAGRSLGLAGWVRNLPSGQVEAVAEGAAELLAQFEAKVRKGPRSAAVRQVDVKNVKGGPVPLTFEIRATPRLGTDTQD